MHLQDWMTKDVVTISGATSLREAIKLIKAREIRHLPVVDRGRLIGIVTETDMLQAFSSLLDDLSISPHLEVTVTGTPGRLQEVSRFFCRFSFSRWKLPDG